MTAPYQVLIAENIHLHLGDQISSLNKTRILVLGRGHSGTTYMQQFIGDVLFDKKDTFYLFEILHEYIIYHFAKAYNFEILNDKDYDTLRTTIFMDLYNCKFNPLVDFNRHIKKHLIVKQINPTLLNMSHNALTNVCLSSKYLIFKEIHYWHYYPNLKILSKTFPNLKIFIMIRNPITHIPSLQRLIHNHIGVNKLVTVTKWVCNEQLKDLKGIYYDDYWKSKANMIFVVKQEEFFANITGDINIFDKYITKLIDSVMDKNEMKQLYETDIMDTNMLRKIEDKFSQMQFSIWKTVGIKNPVKHYNGSHLYYIKQHCVEFSNFMHYTLGIKRLNQ
eukprot:556369_1